MINKGTGGFSKKNSAYSFHSSWRKYSPGLEEKNESRACPPSLLCCLVSCEITVWTNRKMSLSGIEGSLNAVVKGSKRKIQLPIYRFWITLKFWVVSWVYNLRGCRQRWQLNGISATMGMLKTCSCALCLIYGLNRYLLSKIF